MATIEHRTDGGRDEYRIRFQQGGRRFSIAMSGQDEAGAKIAKDHIEHLITQAKRDRPPTTATVRWLDALDDKTHGRLAAVGLTDARKVCELPRHVLAFMENYIERRTDWKKPENHRQAVNHLRAYLGKDVPFGSLTHGDCEDWHRWMMHAEDGPKLYRSTAGQNIKRCRQIFKNALKHGLAKDNPFDEIKVDLRSNEEKDHYVTPEETRAIFDACPSQEWRVIMALSRYGGLRVPSEVLPLKWAMFDWDNHRFTFPTRKTEHQGKPKRTLPIFPELAQELLAWRKELDESRDLVCDEHVIASYRGTGDYLRKAYYKILDAAGVHYEKPYMNNRATRRNEMEQQGCRDVALNAWFGHSGSTAQKYYSKVNEEDYQRVTRGQSWGQVPEDKPTHTPEQDRCKPRKTGPERPGESQGGDGKYTWVDAFRTSLISNIDSIQKLTDRILELDLAV